MVPGLTEQHMSHLLQNLGDARESIYFDFVEVRSVRVGGLPLCVGFAERGLTQGGCLTEMTEQQCI